MNSVLLRSVDQLIDKDETEALRPDLFGYDVDKGTAYLPCLTHTESGLNSFDPETGLTTFSFYINDKTISALGDFSLSFDIPDIFSPFRIAYVPYFAYKLINKVTILDGNSVLTEVDGITLFSRAAKEKVDLSGSGYSRQLNDFNLSHTENLNNQKKYFLPKSKLTVPLIILYPLLETYSTIKTYSKSIIRIDVTMITDLTKVMVYSPDAVFMEDFDREWKGPPSIKRVSLGSIAYAIKERPSNNNGQYVISTYESNGKFSDNAHHISQLDNISHVNFSVCNDLSGKRFMVWAGYDQSENNWVNLYLKKLLSDCIYILPDGTKPEDLPGISEKAEFIKVEHNKIVIKDVKTIDIFVERVPSTYKIWFLSNILSFRAGKDQKIYNITNKINSIHCTWNNCKKNLSFHEINHQIDIGDVSIPISVWDVQTQSNEGDNRSEESKETDVIINDPFLRGIDFLNKQNPIELVTINHGSESIYQSSHNTCYYSLSSSNTIKLPFFQMGYGNLSFGYHSDMGLCPNYLPSDHVRGRSQIKVEVIWNKYDKRDPRYHIQKSVTIQYGIVGEIKKVDEQNVRVIMNSQV